MVSRYPRGGFFNGGVAAAAETLALELSSRSDVEAIEVVNLRTDLAADETMRVNEKLTVRYLRGQRRGVKVTRALRDWSRVRQVAREFRPSVVHGQGLASDGDIATRLGRPSVVTIHGMVHLEARAIETVPVIGRLRVLLLDQLVNRVLRRASIVISISAYDQQVLADRISGSVRTIPNAVRNGLFASEYTPDGNQMLFAGLVTPLKNVCGIVRAFARVRAAVPEASLALAGYAPDAEYLRSVMDEVDKHPPGSVAYLGNLTSDELGDALRRAAIVVLFSEQEVLPCIIAEAMASSRPVISSAVGGVPEMVSDGYTGLLVKPGDEEGLAAGLVKLLRDPAMRRRMAERAHAVARERWSPARVADDTIKAYRAAQAGR
jgi:glycosyltransferase involved in cell wall biosynthesis